MAAIGTTTASNPAADPYAEQNKQIKQQNAQNQQAWQSQQPLMEGNQQANFVPLNKSAYNVNAQAQQQGTDGNGAVLSKLQNTVLQQQPSQIMPLLQQKTQQYLADPNQGYDPAGNKQMQLEQYDRSASQAMEAARQQLGDTSQSGELKNEFLKNAITNMQNRGDLSRKIDTEAAAQNQTNLLNALAQGREFVGTENATNTTGISNLVAARGAAEGERQQTTANTQELAVIEKNFGNSMATLMKDQDWKGAQAELDRQAAVAAQTNDINAKQNLTKLQAQLDMSRDMSTQNWQGAQNELDRKAAVAAQSNDIQSKKDLTVLQSQLDLAKLEKTQDWQSVENDIQRKFEAAAQSKDIEAQSSIVDRQLALDKWKQENGQTFTAEQNAINNALQLTLKDKDAETQTALMELKGKIDKDQLMTSQDFQSVQANLDRQQKEFLAKGDWASALDVIQRKGEIDAIAQKSQQDFETTQTKSAQSWQTSERIGEEDFAKYQQVYDYQMKTAIQNNDIQAQKDLKDQQANIDLKMKTQDLSDDQAKMYYQSQLDEARANGDVDRQKQILTFQATNDFAKMEKQNGYDVAMTNLQSNLTQAEADNDFENTRTLQNEKMYQESLESAKDRAIQQAEVDLQAKGVNMEEMNNQYDYLASEVEAGRADPSVLTQFAQGVLSKAGITITPPDPNAERKAAQEQYNNMVDQFTVTHPEYSTYKTDTGKEYTFDQLKELFPGQSNEWVKNLANNMPKGISPEGQKVFNEFFNSTTYGEETAQQKADKAVAGYLGNEDISYAQEGDKFNITEGAKDVSGNNIPIGKYTVANRAVTTGSKFLGTQRTTNHIDLVNTETGEKFEVRKNKGATQGNIVSNLWAG